MADYVQQLLEHGREYLESSEIAFDEVTRSDTMLSEKEKYYIKMSDIATITKEKVEDARAEGEKFGRAEGEKLGRAEGEKLGRAEGEKLGRAEGEKLGKAEGAQAKQRDIAANMLEMDIDIPTIARATGLSEEEIKALK